MTDDEINAIRTIYDRGYTVTAANDIPALLDEITRLRLAEAEAMALVMNHEGHIARLLADNERLCAALADIARGDYSDPFCKLTPEQRARDALAGK